MKHEAAIDRVLEYLIEHRRVRGEVRATHPRGWVSALHRLTEEVFDIRVPGVISYPHPGHNEYTVISAAVLYLESIGMVEVERAGGKRARQSNYVEVIALAEL